MGLDVLAIYESFGELHSDRSLTASDRPKSLVKKGEMRRLGMQILHATSLWKIMQVWQGYFKIIAKMYGKHLKI